MLIHLPKLVTQWSTTHRKALVLMTSVGLTRYATTAVYGMLTAIVAFSHGELLAGVFFAVFNFIQAFIYDPWAGSMADRFGSKNVVLWGYLCIAAAGVLWLTAPLTNNIILIAFGFLLFLSFSMRDESAAYLLRTSGKKEGGLIFGIAENIYAIANFLASISLPFLVVSGREDIAAITMIAVAICSTIMIARVPNDSHAKSGESLYRTFNFIKGIKDGWHFVKINRNYPLLTLGSSAFEGLFYGALWFVIPLEIARGDGAFFEGLGLGIYEIVTVFLAGYAGFLADKYRWKIVHLAGWLLAIVGAIGLLQSQETWWLVLTGAIIGIGNNFFAFAASHALEAHDIDHREDGAFVGLSNMVSDGGYAIGPLVAGALYYTYGFGGGIGFAVAITVCIGLAMVYMAWRLKD